MIELHDLADVNQSASAFNPEKLLWLSQQHIMVTLPARIGKVTAAIEKSPAIYGLVICQAVRLQLA